MVSAHLTSAYSFCKHADKTAGVAAVKYLWTANHFLLGLSMPHQLSRGWHVVKYAQNNIELADWAACSFTL